MVTRQFEWHRKQFRPPQSFISCNSLSFLKKNVFKTPNKALKFSNISLFTSELFVLEFYFEPGLIRFLIQKVIPDL